MATTQLDKMGYHLQKNTAKQTNDDERIINYEWSNTQLN